MTLCKKFAEALIGAPVTIQYMAIHDLLCPDCSYKPAREVGMLEPKGRTLDEIDYTNHTREEVIEKLKAMGKPTLGPLIRWILQSLEFEKSNYAIQVAIATAQRVVEGTALRVIHAVKEDGDLLPPNPFKKS